ELIASDAHPLLLDVIHRSIQNLQPTPPSTIVFTDDWAPIERLTHAIAVRFILAGSVESLR
ncbi:MAG: hypothetical protein P8X64_16265, partial [Anaerolineales bacterium]